MKSTLILAFILFPIGGNGKSPKGIGGVPQKIAAIRNEQKRWLETEQ